MPKSDIRSEMQDKVRPKLVVLTVTHDCNLRCRYCYEPEKSRDVYMSFQTARLAIEQHMRDTDAFSHVEIDFFGGEPMLAFGMIREIVDWFHTQSWRKPHKFFISTNGTILTEEMRSWLADNRACVQVGVSLDGNKTAHDLNRCNSYDRVMENMEFFSRHWPDQPVKMTISAESIPYAADSIIDLEAKGIPFTANVVFEDIWGDAEHKLGLLTTYGQQLSRLVDYYLGHPELFPARIVDVPLEYIVDRQLLSSGLNDPVRWCGAGHGMLVVETDGSLYPCHRFSPWVTRRPPPDEPVNRQTRWEPETCARCKVNRLCPTCVGFNWEANGSCTMRTSYHCDAFKLEVQASAKLQALKLLSLGSQSLTGEQAISAKHRLDAILDLVHDGV